MSHDQKNTPGRGDGAKPESRASLSDRQTAAVFDGMDWDGQAWRAEAAASPPPSLRQPASSYFSDFPWGD